jgi:hypothetical protein
MMDLPQPNLIEGRYGDMTIAWEAPQWVMRVLGWQVMAHNPTTMEQVEELRPHFEAAHGDVICTGLGMGIREEWVLSKPEVAKLRVIERSMDVIDYHAIHSEWAADPRVSFIHTDARTYEGECDVLLLDHFPDLRVDITRIRQEVRDICGHIKAGVVRAWPQAVMEESSVC